MKVEIVVSGVMEIEANDLTDLRKASWEDTLSVMNDRGVKVKKEVREIYVSDKARIGRPPKKRG